MQFGTVLILLLFTAYQLNNNVPKECSNISGGYLWGIALNRSIIVTKVPVNADQVFNDICIIANTPDVFMFSGQLRLSPNEILSYFPTFSLHFYLRSCLMIQMILLIFMISAL